MARITGHLKTFARKSEPGHPEHVRVDRAIDGTLFLLESQIKAAGVVVDKTVEPDLWVLGHAVQLEQVILNLVRNALDAVGDQEHGRITITAQASESQTSESQTLASQTLASHVQIKVADNGPGIPANQLDQIFDPFFTTKALGKGLGLGLSISYGIVQDFGGQIHARNLPGGGAELTVELPRHQRGRAPAEIAIHA
jgi:two-component system C4-dicarboxylate transport sensor histidine kinase DctB